MCSFYPDLQVQLVRLSGCSRWTLDFVPIFRFFDNCIYLTRYIFFILLLDKRWVTVLKSMNLLWASGLASTPWQYLPRNKAASLGLSRRMDYTIPVEGRFLRALQFKKKLVSTGKVHALPFGWHLIPPQVTIHTLYLSLSFTISRVFCGLYFVTLLGLLINPQIFFSLFFFSKKSFWSAEFIAENFCVRKIFTFPNCKKNCTRFKGSFNFEVELKCSVLRP